MVIQTTFSTHCLARGTGGARCPERHEDVECTERWDNAVFGDSCRARNEMDRRFNDGLQRAVGGGDVGGDWDGDEEGQGCAGCENAGRVDTVQDMSGRRIWGKDYGWRDWQVGLHAIGIALLP